MKIAMIGNGSVGTGLAVVLADRHEVIAADDADARAAVIGLASDSGLDARDAGPLSDAREIEPLADLTIPSGSMPGQGTQIAPVWLSR